MKLYKNLSEAERNAELVLVTKAYNDFKQKGLALDMSRGKPSTEQLDLSVGIFDIFQGNSEFKTENGTDTRNYGLLDGIPEAKRLFVEIMNVKPENIIMGGNSSLNLMYDAIARAFCFGLGGNTPWCKQPKLKFLCPVPGYDRHFAICELFNIEMINIPMTSTGPDMDMIESLVSQDDTIKGIWCVPMYSNPQGITYSDDTVRRFSKLKPKAADFRIYWDDAYCVHPLTNTPDTLLNIFDECSKNGTDDLVIAFASTSKITFSGAGISCLMASKSNITEIKKYLTIQTIGPDKVNQLRHVRYFKNYDGIKAHMQKQRAILEPKFNACIKTLNAEIKPRGIGEFIAPNGGYFISFDTLDGCAKRIVALCKEAGVVLTPAGATYPYGIDPADKNIRIAPTYPPVDELALAMELFCIAVRLASLEALA